MGGWVVGHESWVVSRGSFSFFLKIKYILASSVLGPNYAHELISPNSFYETLNKGKLSLVNY